MNITGEYTQAPWTGRNWGGREWEWTGNRSIDRAQIMPALSRDWDD